MFMKKGFILIVSVLGGLCVLLTATVFYLLCLLPDRKEVLEVEELPIPSEVVQTDLLQIEILGAVKEPGVYEVEKGSRLEEALLLAGGTLETANINEVDKERVLQEDETIQIPLLSSVGNDKKQEETKESAKKSDTSKKEDKENVSSNGKVSLNKASLKELMTLNGIGETKAQAIINYRNTNGAFVAIEELMQVKGIGEKTFEKIKGNLTL